MKGDDEEVQNIASLESDRIKTVIITRKWSLP